MANQFDCVIWVNQFVTKEILILDLRAAQKALERLKHRGLTGVILANQYNNAFPFKRGTLYALEVANLEFAQPHSQTLY
jgi:hypothetical protein